MPMQIIFFCDGISKGEYNIVGKEEIEDIEGELVQAGAGKQKWVVVCANKQGQPKMSGGGHQRARGSADKLDQVLTLPYYGAGCSCCQWLVLHFWIEYPNIQYISTQTQI